jgi:hypothetical protein
MKQRYNENFLFPQGAEDFGRSLVFPQGNLRGLGTTTEQASLDYAFLFPQGETEDYGRALMFPQGQLHGLAGLGSPSDAEVRQSLIAHGMNPNDPALRAGEALRLVGVDPNNPLEVQLYAASMQNRATAAADIAATLATNAAQTYRSNQIDEAYVARMREQAANAAIAAQQAAIEANQAEQLRSQVDASNAAAAAAAAANAKRVADEFYNSPSQVAIRNAATAKAVASASTAVAVTPPVTVQIPRTIVTPQPIAPDQVTKYVVDFDGVEFTMKDPAGKKIGGGSPNYKTLDIFIAPFHVAAANVTVTPAAAAKFAANSAAPATTGTVATSTGVTTTTGTPVTVTTNQTTGTTTVTNTTTGVTATTDPSTGTTTITAGGINTGNLALIGLLGFLFLRGAVR